MHQQIYNSKTHTHTVSEILTFPTLIIMEPIGQLIKDELNAQERSVAWFARKLCLDRSNVYCLFQKNSIDTSLLTRISLVLNKDFFSLLSEYVQQRQNSQQ